MNRALLWVALAVLPASSAQAQRLGRWIAGDGDIRMVVELVQDGDQLNGRVDRVINREGVEVAAMCDDCPGEMAGKPLKGLPFIKGLRRGTGKVQWVDGRVLDFRPGSRQGREASCELSFRDGKVDFYGYLGLHLLGHREVWPPFQEAPK